MYSATCSQCKRTFRAKTKSRLLIVISKHRWKEHRAWMAKRVKAGRAKTGGNPPVVGLLRDLATGDFVPGYKKYKRDTYEVLKPALDILAKHLPLPMQAAWKTVDKLADFIYR